VMRSFTDLTRSRHEETNHAERGWLIIRMVLLSTQYAGERNGANRVRVQRTTIMADTQSLNQNKIIKGGFGRLA
jgi:hypothetical protein